MKLDNIVKILLIFISFINIESKAYDINEYINKNIDGGYELFVYANSI